MFQPKKDIKDIERLKEIVEVFFDQGFHTFIQRLRLKHHLPFTKRFRTGNQTAEPARLRETFERLGPTFVKFGQILAQRPDIIPSEYAKELEKLEDDVPSFESQKAKEIIDEEIGMDIFSSFEDEPIGSASIAQVHRAKLESGEEVAVKVRRPDIKPKIEKDLDILLYLSEKAEKHSGNLGDLAHEDIKEFAKWTRKELDLKAEGRNAEKMSENLEDEENVKIPDIYPDITTEKVLVMEYVEGVKCDNLEALEDIDVERKEIAETALRSGLKQILRDGFFHADPHPSNYLVSPEGELIYLDFGMMGRIGKETRKNLGLLVLYLAREDAESAVRLLRKIGIDGGDLDVEKLREEIQQQIFKIKETNLEDQSLTKSLVEINVKAVESGLMMPSFFVIVGKTMVTMEGIAVKLYPELSPVDHYRKLIRELIVNKYSPKEIGSDLALNLMENEDLITELPSKINNLGTDKSREITRQQNQKKPEIVLAALILGSTFALSGSISSQKLMILGSLQLVLAGLFFRKL